MKYRYSSAIITLAAVFSFVFYTVGCGNSRAKQTPQRVVPVKIGEVSLQQVPLQIRAIGNVEAYNTVSVKALVGGEVISVNFKEGQDVKQGALLFQIDPRPYQAALKQAEAQMAKDVAQAKNAEEQAKRYQILVQKDYVSRDQYDQYRANADALLATVEADRANVENSRLQLAYCTIRSPIDGKVGSVLVNLGNIVKPNDVTMLTINKIAPIYVTFSVPEKNLADIKKYMLAKSLKIEALILGDENRPAQGRLTFIDNAVDTTTGTIKLKGTFENRDRRLWPGQFVNVVLTLTIESNAIVLPAAALQAGQQGQYVFVMKSDSTVEYRPVTVARLHGELAVIAQGVQQGEKVVTDGQFQLTAGTRVEVKGEQPAAPVSQPVGTAQSKKTAPR